MHPFIAEQLVRAHGADLYREAEEARLARRARPTPAGRPHRRMRIAIGERIVRLGLRLAGAGNIWLPER